SRQSGGDAGWYLPDDLSPEISKVVFNLKQGQVSELIETKQGFYVFKLVEKKEPKVPTMDEARSFVIEMIKEQKFAESYKKYIEQLKKEHYVRLNPKYV
ncbi:MAG: peptidylprolyl isomerase, partial [Acidobacteria bacterium]|nr:peptidylprolyl isomerase [Acidobacteriota bacterium]